ncbi:hypothetical protein TRFO_01946 [Tritrichomonas foetus]|uniref:RING-type domain-containing protein n=1 Tax=Tritrichomonas foetus TaxID=1144522 RepID=A0A1J4JDZ2_9EUKA|nr:hypothetical protein TRFO_01946 [Tritrichomonas foetus]|eukprot:OHS96873.1 hypothetical protein TRFO_01946 [Tritrichomonas foetus]
MEQESHSLPRMSSQHVFTARIDQHTQEKMFGHPNINYNQPFPYYVSAILILMTHKLLEGRALALVSIVVVCDAVKKVEKAVFEKIFLEDDKKPNFFQSNIFLYSVSIVVSLSSIFTNFFPNNDYNFLDILLKSYFTSNLFFGLLNLIKTYLASQRRHLQKVKQGLFGIILKLALFVRQITLAPLWFGYFSSQAVLHSRIYLYFYIFFKICFNGFLLIDLWSTIADYAHNMNIKIIHINYEASTFSVCNHIADDEKKKKKGGQQTRAHSELMNSRYDSDPGCPCDENGEWKIEDSQESAKGEIEGEIQPKKIEEVCSICLTDPQDPVRLAECGHVFCSDCLFRWIKDHPSCPMCRASVAQAREVDGADGIIPMVVMLCPF